MIEQHNENQGAHDEKWQQDVLTKLVFASLTEQRRTRRWNIFFKAVFIAYLLLLMLVMVFPAGDAGKVTSGMHTALIEIDGVIASNGDVSADRIVTGLRNAFKNKDTKGIILRINSPGGSPVQAGYINDEITRLRKLHPEIKVYAVIADICASGGYYIAAAADAIYADKASLVGSIGVVMNSFGFVEAIDKLGVERRLYTAGENKGFLDPFSPERKEEVAHVKTMLSQIHQQFIDTVKQGRGDKLKDNDKLFSGLIWTGEESVKLGLVDGLGSSSYVAREIIQAENIVDYTPRERLLERLADRLGASMASTLARSLKLESMLPQ